MCGIAGFISKDKEIIRNSEKLIKKMLSTLEHRGPDAKGFWTQKNFGVAMGNTRLSIQDVSSNGRQPVASQSGRYTLVFNGEIYNHGALRKIIETDYAYFSWRGSSDTETLVACINYWGLEKTLENLVGMFAFALWDDELKKMFLARDRLGEKPLYYGVFNGDFFFASELKALKIYPKLNLTLSEKAIRSYLATNYIPAPLSIYNEILKLKPGTFVELINFSEPKSFWSIDDFFKPKTVKPIGLEEKRDFLKTKLVQTISKQIEADVPVGVFLSGGVDSSLVTSIAQDCVVGKLNTFCIGFENKKFDEAPFARDIASHLKTDHHELYLNGTDAKQIVADISNIYDEPFADISQIPTIYLSRLTAKSVKVALTGDGGDELFGGYPRYLAIERLWKIRAYHPKIFKHIWSFASRLLLANRQENAMDADTGFLKTFHDYRTILAQKLERLSYLIDIDNPRLLYEETMMQWTLESGIFRPILKEFETSFTFSKNVSDLDVFQMMMYHDLINYLPDDLLVKVDRASMASSLECRAPFLDHTFVSEALRLSRNQLTQNGESKWPLRAMLQKRVPSKLVNRPKMGFGCPIGDWLMGPLKEWADNLLTPKNLRANKFVNEKPIILKWEEHQSGEKDWSTHLWNVLILQDWMDRNGYLRNADNRLS